MKIDSAYNAPDTYLAESSLTYSGREIAGKGRRFLNLVVDAFAVQVLAMLAALVALRLGLPPSLLSGFGAYGFTLVIWLAYYIVMEGTTGRTLGKYVTGTMVVDNTSRIPSWGRVVGRSLARAIPLESLSFLFGTEGPGKGWHDNLSDTLVVVVRRAGRER